MKRLSDLTELGRHGVSMARAAVRKRLDATRPLPEAERRDYTLAELGRYDGRDAGAPVLLAVRGRVYDVIRGRAFYGPGGPYAAFAGRDCTRALALMSTDTIECIGDLTGLTPAELAQLDEWVERFERNYAAIGALTSE